MSYRYNKDTLCEIKYLMIMMLHNGSKQMEILGVTQLQKKYKTPSYVRRALKNYQQRQNKSILEAEITAVTEEKNKEKRSCQSNSDACKKHRLKKKLEKIASQLDTQYLKGVIEKLGGNEDDYNDLVINLKALLGKKIEDKLLLEYLIGGSKKQPSSIVAVMVYHILKDKFESLTHATEVLQLNIKTLTVNHEDLVKALQLVEETKYKICVSGDSGDVILHSYISEVDFHGLLNALPKRALRVAH